MKKVLCPGEALIDFVAIEALGNLKDSSEFVKKAGGAPANAAGAMAKFGVEAYFMGSVGNDPFGQFLKETLATYNINITHMQSIDVPTTLAFVSLTTDGERDFKFNRGADSKLKIEDETILQSFDCFHFASATAFLGDELKISYDQILEYGIKHNKLITFDANYRDALFGDQTELFITECRRYISHSHITKVSDEEAILLTGIDDLIEAGTKLQQLSGNYVLLTLGANGTYLFSNQGMIHIPSQPVKMVDSTGAGDAFIGTVVALAVKEQQLSLEKMIEIVTIANQVGAITTTKYGALESIPSLDEIEM